MIILRISDYKFHTSFERLTKRESHRVQSSQLKLTFRGKIFVEYLMFGEFFSYLDMCIEILCIFFFFLMKCPMHIKI